MDRYTLRTNVTPSRRRWLLALAEGPKRRSEERSRAVHDCERLGWTRALYERGLQTRDLPSLEFEYGGFSALYADGWRHFGLYELTADGCSALTQPPTEA